MLKAIIKKTKDTINIVRHQVDSKNFNKVYYFDNNNNPYGEDELIFINNEDNMNQGNEQNQLPEGFKVVEVNAESAEDIIKMLNNFKSNKSSNEDKYAVGLSMVNMVLSTFSTIVDNSETSTFNSKGEINDELLAKSLHTACEIVDAAAEILSKMDQDNKN